MKTLLRKTNDKAFDNLLRSHFGRPADSAFACSGFDPDLANAYIERGLAGVERARYERHLSDCAGCRTSVVALARMADADSITTALPNVARDSGLRESGWLSSLKTGLWVIASPRWAIVATALVVISISMPLLWRGGAPRVAQDKQIVESDKDRLDDSTHSPSASFDKQSAESRAGVGEPAPQIAAGNRPSEREPARRETVAEGFTSKGDIATTAGAATQPPTETPERKSSENGQLAADRDDSRLKENTTEKVPAAAAPLASVQTKTEENAKISKDGALRLPAEDESSAKVRTLKPGTVDAGPKTELEKDRFAAITPKDSEAPKPKAKPENETRGSLAVGARSRALVGETARPDRAHTPERKVGKKTFWLTRGIWTDSDYNSDQRLPVVTVVRDSDVYNEMLEKNNSKLKALFKAFTGTESVIIVFKSTVYSVIPQADNKQ